MEVVLIILLILLLNAFFVKVLKSNFKVKSEGYLWLLFTVHFILTIAYILYSSSSRSDSFNYYNKTLYTDDWFSFFKSGTKFIGFLAWPLTQTFGLGYYSVMLIFSYIGYFASVFFYLVAVENIELKPAWGSYTPLELVFLLPNVHFWTSSLGKGSVITFAIGLLAFGLSRINRRILPTIIGAILIYMVRPHILLAIILASVIGLIVTSGGLKPFFKWSIIIVSVFLFINLSGSVLKFTDTDTLDFTTSTTLSHRTSELSKASSGIDIGNYNFVYKIFTFWFRPLFFDGLGVLGFLASFENLFCLFMAFQIIKWLVKSWSSWNGYFKISLFAFLLGSVILAQITGNLGIALRQKAQLMPFFFILYLKALSLNPINKKISKL
ncbi:MAG: hypothetical protein NT127_03460 [Sphingobacteriales bacterium]|nr:hypothetical protein [Sphingobacteriales bacterium]